MNKSILFGIVFLVLISSVNASANQLLNDNHLMSIPLNFSNSTYGVYGGDEILRPDGYGAWGNYVYSSGVDIPVSSSFNTTISPNTFKFYRGGTIYMWINTSNPAGANYLFGSSNGASAPAIFIYEAGDLQWDAIVRGAGGSSCTISVANATLFNQVPHFWLINYDATNTNISVWVDGVRYTEATSGDCSGNASIHQDLFFGDLNWAGAGLGAIKSGFARFGFVNESVDIENVTIRTTLQNSTYPYDVPAPPPPNTSYLNTRNASISPLPTAFSNETLLGYCEGNSSQDLEFQYKVYNDGAVVFEQLSNICHQETATEDAGCGGLISNSGYAVNSEWTGDGTNTYDGSYATFDEKDGTASPQAYLYSNYSRPAGITTSTQWSLTAGNNAQNFTLSSACLDLDPIRIRTESFLNAIFDAGVSASCYNGTDWEEFYSNITGSGDDNHVYEESFYWFINRTYADNTLVNIHNISNQFFNKTDEIIFSCRAYNSTANDVWLNSSTVTILNTPPAITSVSPYDEFIDNQLLNASATLSDADGDSINCSLYINSTLNSSSTGLSDGVFWLSPTNLSDGNFDWYLNCTDGENFTVTTERLFIYDTINPIIRVKYPLDDNSTRTNESSFNLNIDIVDTNNYWTEINITNPSSVNVFSTAYNTTGDSNYTITSSVTNGVTGNYTINIMGADGHTKKEIPEMDVSKDLFKKEKIKFKYGGETILYPKGDGFKDSKFKKYKDKYTFGFIRDKDETRLEPYDIVVVESTGYIDIIYDSEYKGHLILREGSLGTWKWIDFETDEDYPVSITKVNDNKVEVIIWSDADIDLSFESLGLLNIQTTNIQYYYNNITENISLSYTNPIVCSRGYNYTLNYTVNDAVHNAPEDAYLDINGTNLSISYSLSDTNWYYYNLNGVTPCGQDNGSKRWYVNVSYINNTYHTVKSPLFYQNITTQIISLCDANVSTHLFNISYYDDISLLPINVTNQYTWFFNDGWSWYNISGTASASTEHLWCTNVNNTVEDINYSLYGNLVVSASGYVTRSLTYSASQQFNFTNSESSNLTIFMVDSDSSGTITFNWLTYQYVPINGTMNIYQCNADGSQTLSETTPITTGVAYANLRLLTNQYSYTVEIDNVLYDGGDYNRCHTESALTRTYYIDLLGVDVSDVMGFMFVSCGLEKTNDTTREVTMVWGVNPVEEDNITACIVGKRQTIYNWTEVYRNCSEATYGSYSVTVPDNNNIYEVYGEISQDGYSSRCRDIITFYEPSNIQNRWGIDALFSVVILILSMGLLFVGEGTLMVVGAYFGAIVAFILGLLAVGWIAIMELIIFGLVLMLIARYVKKR